jgi:phage scaffold protein|nr:MAG TPA: capsid scaffolding protein [Caudoviricetes sp.]DAS42888.1 MAG TPA: capsid scaffolding protein [Caudoviricetes sp.]DAU59117.1 MAG TPA: capsid scaffolding protein [Caudoviricetes sp.]
MSENTQAAVETEALEKDVAQEEQVETKQEKSERTFTRAEFGKAVAAEIAKARATWESEQAEALELAKSEGERLAKLTKDERAREEEAKRLKAIEERERAIAEREMKMATMALLVEEGLPQEFLGHVLAPTAEEVKAKISDLRNVFDKEVEKRVNERLVQSTPRRGAINGLTKEDIMAIENDDERQRAIAENIQLFRKG